MNRKKSMNYKFSYKIEHEWLFAVHKGFNHFQNTENNDGKLLFYPKKYVSFSPKIHVLKFEH